jgi:hypothetical protein
VHAVPVTSASGSYHTGQCLAQQSAQFQAVRSTRTRAVTRACPPHHARRSHPCQSAHLPPWHEAFLSVLCTCAGSCAWASQVATKNALLMFWFFDCMTAHRASVMSAPLVGSLEQSAEVQCTARQGAATLQKLRSTTIRIADAQPVAPSPTRPAPASMLRSCRLCSRALQDSYCLASTVAAWWQHRQQIWTAFQLLPHQAIHVEVRTKQHLVRVQHPQQAACERQRQYCKML